MAQQRNRRLPRDISGALDRFPQTKAMSARIAILRAAARPELLPTATRVRKFKDKTPEKVTIAVRRNRETDAALDEMSAAFDISVEEVFRLAMEVYIYKL